MRRLAADPGRAPSAARSRARSDPPSRRAGGPASCRARPARRSRRAPGSPGRISRRERAKGISRRYGCGPPRRGGDTAARPARPSAAEACRGRGSSTSGPHKIACTQIGGLNWISTRSAAPAITKPTIRITKTAGPSAESAKEKSSPQTRQRGASVRKPVEEPALPAARTDAPQPVCDRILRRVEGLVLAHRRSAGRSGPSRAGVTPSCRRRSPRHRCR